VNHKLKVALVGIAILALNMGADKECERKNPQEERVTGIDRDPGPITPSCRDKVLAVMEQVPEQVPACEGTAAYQIKVVALSTWDPNGEVTIRENSSGKWVETKKNMPFGDTGNVDPGNEFPGHSRSWSKIVHAPREREWTVTVNVEPSRDRVKRTMTTCQIVHFGGEKDGDITSKMAVNMATRGGFIDCVKEAGK